MAKQKPTQKHRKPVRRSRLQRFFALRLQHPKHSFKILPHHHTSYPLLGLVVLLAAIFCVGWTAFAKGDSFVTTAIVPDVPLTAPATLDHPVDGAVFDHAAITLSGTCPDDSYVAQIVDGHKAGVDLCQADHTWSLPVTLDTGVNTLTVQAFNRTDEAGPATPPIRVTYQPPRPPAGETATPSTGSTSPSQPSAHSSDGAGEGSGISNPNPTPAPSAKQPLTIWSDYTYKAAKVGEVLDQQLFLSGGVGPFAISVDWGDGQTSLGSQASVSVLNLSHIYHKPGSYKHSYVITVRVVDASGKVVTLQLVAIIVPENAGAVLDTGRAKDDLLPDYGSFLRLAVPTFAVITVALSGFWLGQHRELEMLHRQAVVRHRRRSA